MYDGFLTSGHRADRLFRRCIDDDASRATLSRAFQIYYRLRPLIPVALRRYLQGHRRLTIEDDWFVADDFIRSLAREADGERDGMRIVHPWPDGSQFCFVLTHDVDTAEGLRNVRRVARIEEELGFRSSWNIVPHKYDIDLGLIEELRSRSFEIGIHGYNHDGRLYSSRRVFQRRVPAINEALRKYGAVGFRSPMVHRNLRWLQALDIEYDASSFDVDPFQASPGGVGGIWPFIAGKFVELPYTLPQDHTLLIAYGQKDCKIWERKCDFVARNHGMALMLTHPDYLVTDRHLSLYRDFLARVRDRGGYWHALPAGVAQWWRSRSRSRISKDSLGQWRVEGPLADRGRPAAVDVEGETIALRPL